jgi:hypothetical protein
MAKDLEESRVIVQVDGHGPFDEVRWRAHVEASAEAAGVTLTAEAVSLVPRTEGAGGTGEEGETWRLRAVVATRPWSYGTALAVVARSLVAYRTPASGLPEPAPRMATSHRRAGATAVDVGMTKGAAVRARVVRAVNPWAALLPKAAFGPAPLRAAANATLGGGSLETATFTLSESTRRTLAQGGSTGAGAWPTTLCRDFLLALDDWNQGHGGSQTVSLDFAVGAVSSHFSEIDTSPSVRRLRATPQDFKDAQAISRYATTAMLGAETADAVALPELHAMRRAAALLLERARPTAVLATVVVDPFLDHPVVRDRDGQVVVDRFTITRILLTTPPPHGVGVSATAVIYAGGVGCTVSTQQDTCGVGGAQTIANLWTSRLELAPTAPADRAEDFARLLDSHAAYKGRTEPLRGLPIGKGVRPGPLGLPPQLTP